MRIAPHWLFLGCCTLGMIRTVAATDCIESLYDIRLAEHSVEEPYQLRRYILCPHTVYEIGDSFGDGGKPNQEGKHSPLLLSRSNVHILCGEDGRSDNECVLRGGHVQLHMSKSSLHSSPAWINNTVVQGLTFADTTTHAVLAEHDGALELRDCIFQDNEGMSVIYAQRLIKTNVDHSLRAASLDELSSGLLNVVVDGCAFMNNQIWGYSGVSTEGLITFEQGASLDLRNSVFVGNKVDKPLELAYLVGVEKGNLKMKNNCFYDNDFRIVPVALSSTTHDVSSNYLRQEEENESSTGCPFMALLMDGGLLSGASVNRTFHCEDADSNTCPASETLTKVSALVSCQSLDTVIEAERQVEDPSRKRIYTLCPNSTHHIPDSAMLTIRNSNVKIMCGLRGLRRDQCLVRGGSVQVLVADDRGIDSAEIDNVVLQGLTFSGAEMANVVILTPANVQLKDCLFEENRNLVAVYAGSGTTSTVLSTVLPPMHNHAHGRVEVSITNTLFSNNHIGAVFGQHTGIVTGEGADVKIVGCSFFDTTNKAQEPNTAYMVGMFGGSLELRESCFSFNEATIAPVVLEGTRHQLSFNGGQGNSFTDPQCEFALDFGQAGTQYVTQEEYVSTCWPFDVDECVESAVLDGIFQGDNPRLPVLVPPTAAAPSEDNSGTEPPSIPLLGLLVTIAALLAGIV